MTRGANFNASRAARILAEAEILGDKNAATRNSCHVRTIRNYRQRLERDEEFAQLFRSELAKIDSEWMVDTIRTLRVVLAQMREKAESASFGELADSAEKLTGVLVVANGIGIGAGAAGAGESSQATPGGDGEAYPPPVH